MMRMYQRQRRQQPSRRDRSTQVRTLTTMERRLCELQCRDSVWRSDSLRRCVTQHQDPLPCLFAANRVSI